MTQNSTIPAIEALVEKLIAAYEDIFLVSVRIKPTNNIKIFLDADNGLSIDKCVKINRGLYKVIEEDAWYPDGNFSLEVSSSGVDEPLKMLRQYKKNIGRNLEVTLMDESKLTGKLTVAEDSGIVITYVEGKNKKAVTHVKEIAFSDIKQSIVLISF